MQNNSLEKELLHQQIIALLTRNTEIAFKYN